VIRRYAFLAVLPIAALLAGCGGGGDDDSTEAAPVATTAVPELLSKDELIEQGDAICAEVNAAVGTIGASSAETSPVAQVADLYTGMITNLKNLGAPQESSGYPEFVAAADELSTAQGEVKLASERGETAGLEAAEANASAALSSFQSAAQEYGFEACGEGPSAPSVTAAPESGETGSAEAPAEPEVEAEEPEVEAEPAPEPAPETGGAGGTGGGATGAPEGGGTTGGESGGIGPG
jgi:hypothetical protein